jgi:dihydropyrimidine dehydrogenase (NAD+) subunit PreA
MEQISTHSLEENLEALKKLKENYPNKVLIASIIVKMKKNGQSLQSLLRTQG